jgi:uncharacterized membrane protein YfcA
MIDAFGGRKFLAWVIQMVVLIGVFVGLLLFGALTTEIFVAWLGALCLTMGLYDVANALSKKYQQPTEKPPAQ